MSEPKLCPQCEADAWDVRVESQTRFCRLCQARDERNDARQEERALRERLAAAEADGAAMREAMEEVHDELDTTRIRENGLEVIVPQSDWIALDACRSRIAALLASDHPGADLLARATAAEAVVEALRTSGVRLVDATAELVRAWEAYDARVQECAGDSETGRLENKRDS